MFRGLLRPGQGFRPYTVLRRKGSTTATGRPVARELVPISHTVLQRGVENQARAEDVLELKSPDGSTVRRFLVQGVHDPAELGHFTSYQVLEREDL